jgi:hypothetical protein
MEVSPGYLKKAEASVCPAYISSQDQFGFTLSHFTPAIASLAQVLEIEGNLSSSSLLF